VKLTPSGIRSCSSRKEVGQVQKKVMKAKSASIYFIYTSLLRRFNRTNMVSISLLLLVALTMHTVVESIAGRFLNLKLIGVNSYWVKLHKSHEFAYFKFTLLKIYERF
jgi:hypothetical protein